MYMYSKVIIVYQQDTHLLLSMNLIRPNEKFETATVCIDMSWTVIIGLVTLVPIYGWTLILRQYYLSAKGFGLGNGRPLHEITPEWYCKTRESPKFIH